MPFYNKYIWPPSSCVLEKAGTQTMASAVILNNHYGSGIKFCTHTTYGA